MTEHSQEWVCDLETIMNGLDYGKPDIKAILWKKPAEKSGKIFLLLEMEMWSRIYESQHSSKLANHYENLCVPHAN